MISSDLQDKRYEIAKDIMTMSLSNEDLLDYISSNATYKEHENRTVPKSLARFAIAFQEDNYKCLIEFNEKFDFYDYDNCPLLEFQITTDDKNWDFLSDPIEDYFNL